MKRYLPAFTVFLGSFLLFGVQPMLGRTLLPSFGGTAAVWTVCLAAYQTLLLVGYFYAHLLAKWAYRVQRVTHVSLLVLAVFWTAAFAFWRPSLKAVIGNSGTPELEVLFWVLMFVGLPYVLLSAGSTLVQAWLSNAGRNVYRLYAVSNLGSFLGLLFYPLVLEPYVAVNGQWWGFALLLTCYIALLVALRRQAGPQTPAASCQRETSDRTPTSAWLWFVLPAVSSFALVATTNRLTLETTPMPLFWVLLLSAFLLSYVVGFSERVERKLPVLLFATLVACIGAGAAQWLEAATAFEWILLSGVAFLFLGGTLLHGWLHASRPDTTRLTTFYLGIAGGGAVGGMAGALVAPVLFKTVFEFPLAILMVIAVCWQFAQHAALGKQARLAAYGLAVLAVVCGSLCRRTHMEGSAVLTRARNFYGTLRVERKVFVSQYGSEQALHYFKHGNTMHGIQFRDTGLSKIPTAYYGEHAGGIPIISHPKRVAGQPMRVGLVGLGVGVLAALGHEGDTFRFYEINPQVIGIATNPVFFSFISDSPSKVEIVEGDARKKLEEERRNGAEKFDVLIIDIFSGDSIAPHMISAEAFELYKDRLAPDGIFGIHISNWHIDLFPVCKAVAKKWGANIVGVVARADKSRAEINSCWSFLSQAKLPPLPENCLEVDFSRVADTSLTTDDKGSLLNLIRFVTPPPIKDQKRKEVNL